MGLLGPNSNPPIGWTFGIAFGNDSFVTVGESHRIMSSKDGITWTSHASPTSQHLNSIVYGHDTFVFVGNAGTIVQSAPVIGAPPVISGRFNYGAFEILLEGTVGQSYGIQSADYLSGFNLWRTIGTLTLTNHSGTWSDSTAKDHNRRFYRAVTQP